MNKIIDWLLKTRRQLLILMFCPLLAFSISSTDWSVNLCGVLILKSYGLTNPNNLICLDHESTIHQQLFASDDGKYMLGIFYYWQNDYNKAISFMKNLNTQANNLDSYWLGYFYFQQGDLDQAVAIWKDNQPYAAGLWQQARERAKFEDYEEAIRLYQIATLLLPEESDLWLEYGKSLWKTKYNQVDQDSFSEFALTQEIKKAFFMAVSLNPADFESLDRYAWYIYYVEEDYIRALDYLKKAWDQGGNDDPWVNYHLGRIYEDLENNEEAYIYFQIAYSQNPPNNLLIPNIYAQFLIRVGDKKTAIEVIEKSLLPIDQKNPVHYLRLVILYMDRCDIYRAKEYLTAAEKLDLGENLLLYGKAKDLVSKSSCN